MTFQPEELIATKIRALYQRKKGRDLFDLWLALTVLKMDPQRILASFAPYRPEQFTGPQAIANLRRKLATRDFLEDLNSLAVRPPSEYVVEDAGELIITELLGKIT